MSEERIAGVTDFSADHIRRLMADDRAEKAAKQLAEAKAQEEKRKALIAEFHKPSERTPEQLLQMVMQLVKQAADHNQSEVQVYRSPSESLSDRGRRINNAEPDWAEALEGRPNLPTSSGANG
jgi:aspartate carbamoyltransferase catalytic subunit